MKFAISPKPEFEIVSKFFLFPRCLRHWPEDGPSSRETLGVGPTTTSELDALNVPEDEGYKSWVWLTRCWVVKWRLGQGFRSFFLANKKQISDIEEGRLP